MLHAQVEQQIRERAYHVWLEGGCQEGQDERNWLVAEREVLSVGELATVEEATAPQGVARRRSRSAGTRAKRH